MYESGPFARQEFNETPSWVWLELKTIQTGVEYWIWDLQRRDEKYKIQDLSNHLSLKGSAFVPRHDLPYHSSAFHKYQPMHHLSSAFSLFGVGWHTQSRNCWVRCVGQ